MESHWSQVSGDVRQASRRCCDSFEWLDLERKPRASFPERMMKEKRTPIMKKQTATPRVMEDGCGGEFRRLCFIDIGDDIMEEGIGDGELDMKGGNEIECSNTLFEKWQLNEMES